MQPAFAAQPPVARTHSLMSMEQVGPSYLRACLAHAAMLEKGVPTDCREYVPDGRDSWIRDACVRLHNVAMPHVARLSGMSRA